MSPPLISIVMPVYNGSNYMRAAIDSALAQDYPHVEVIVINDGSRDDGATDAIARSYGDRVRYVSQPNGGVASALNRGLAEMRGDVFCWLSHDDIHLPHKTSRQVGEWESRGRPDEILISDYRLINEAGEPQHDVVLNHALIAEKPLYALLRGSIHGCSVFIPRRIFDAVGNFDETLPTTQDYDLWNRMIRRYRFRHMPEILIESRQHDEQGSKKLDHRIEARALWTRMVRGVPREEQERLEGSPYRFIGATAKFLVTCGLPDIAQDLIEDAGAALAATPVTLVLLPSAQAERVATSLDSARQQDHPALDILVLHAGEEGDAASIAAATHGISRLRCDTLERGAALKAGWRAATGRYVAFLEPGDLLRPEFVTRMLRAMENAAAPRGAAAGWLRRAGRPGLQAVPAQELATSARLSGLMFRRDGDTLSAPGPELVTAMLDEALVLLRDPPAGPTPRPADTSPAPGASPSFSAADLQELV